MSIRRNIELWIATVHLHNGQTLEIEVRGKTIKACKETLKQDTQIKKIIKFRKL